VVIGRLARWVNPSDPGADFDMAPYIAEIVKGEGPVHYEVLGQRLREAWEIGRLGSRIRENIDRGIRAAGLSRDGDFVDVDERDRYVVRTPTDEVARSVEQVHDFELREALVRYAHDSRGITEEELTVAVARLYGWGRRGPDISSRLSGLVQKLLNSGDLIGNADRLTSPDRAAEPPDVRRE
jgi:hypothetical protein